MLLFRGLLLVTAIAVWAYSVFDVIRSEQSEVRYLHKLVWLLLVLIFSPIGPLAWLFLGRPVPLASRLFEPRTSAPRPPDDSPEFLASLDEEIRRRRRADKHRAPQPDPSSIDEEIRRLEDELRRRSENGEDDRSDPLS